MSGYRLFEGGRIDRQRPIQFTFGGKRMSGFDGDTLASALLANGVDVTARSFKYHRPRGIVGAGIEEPATYVELLGEDASANQPATVVRLIEGLQAMPVNCWPSVDFDLGAVNQLFSRLIPASFYYKTFKWPNWHLYEPAIRRAAGLASAPNKPPKQGRYEARHWHCDILIAGAGPAGLIAALTAGRSGKRVLIADEGFEAGGSLLSRRKFIEGREGAAWVNDAVTALSAMPNVTHLQNATVWGYREGNLLLVNERRPKQSKLIGRNWRIRAKQVIIATGAIERSLVFAGNDRPGVMLASAVQTYVNRYGVAPGKKAVIFTNNSASYEVVADMERVGIEVAAIVDSRHNGPQEIEKRLIKCARILPGSQVLKAHGSKRVRRVTVRDKQGKNHIIDCDLLAISGGWSPTAHLFSQSRGNLIFDPKLSCFRPDTSLQNVVCVGAANGDMTLASSLAGAQKAAGSSEITSLEVGEECDYAVEPLWHIDDLEHGAKGFVDLMNDVTLADVHLAIQEGYEAVEHVKRYTTGGMAMDQGKTGNINIIGSIARHQGVPLDEVGTTTFRSPYSPVEFGAIGGIREGSVVLPYRHTPMTQWNIDQNCFMYEAGARWRRPGYFPRDGETFQQTVNREASCVRTAVGVYDGSPLGTYEIKGKDCARLLDFVYTNLFSTLKPGEGRYGLMLTDDGLILDDGVSFMLGKNRYIISTSTGHADAVFQHLNKILQVERPEWEVKITDVTSQWANATVCGPRAREVIRSIGTDIDLDADSFPFMTFRDGTVAGLPARVVRVSFTGELSFEINVAPRHLLELWDKIMDAGQTHGIMPIGSEANHVLRVEKGFLSLGHEVDGTVDPYDLGMSWIISKKKSDFFGARSVQLRRKADGVRRELVGIISHDPTEMVVEGAPLTPGGKREPSEGLVTAYVWSVAKQRTVGLALLENGRARTGETVYVRLKERSIPVEVTEPCFYDPCGTRMRG